MKRIARKIIFATLIILGYNKFASRQISSVIISDYENKDVPWKTKIWSWRKKFSASRVYTYGINENNLKSHIPDFLYYNMHPINGEYSRWIDDKMTMMYILSPFSDYVPDYYFQIEKHEIMRLKDCPMQNDASIHSIVNLLIEKKNLALKPISGSLGDGFFWLQYRDDVYYINCSVVSRADIEQLLYNLNGYLVTEYVLSNSIISKINPKTPNTIRVQVTRMENFSPKITGCFIRFGTDESGVSESPTKGGIIARVNIIDGYVNDAYRIDRGVMVSVLEHPDTKVKFEFYIPYWDRITSKIIEIMNYLPQLRYAGFDIVVTEDNFKILEINSLTSTTVLPYYYPILEDDYNREFFKHRYAITN